MPKASDLYSLRQLQYAVAVADELNFRKAAERCHVSQPSLSTQITQLERALGVQLFERDRRGVIATAAGADVLARARQILMQADDLLDAAKRAGDHPSRTLRVGVLPTISPYLLPVAARALRKRFPRLSIAWVEDKTAVLAAKLHEGALDAALLALEAELGDVDREVVAKDAFVLAAPRDHALAGPTTPARVADLRGIDVLLLDDGHCFRKQVLALCARAHAKEFGFRATSLTTLAQMVASGAGVTLLPALAVATEARRADIRVRPFAPPAPRRTLALVWRKSSPLASELRTIARTLRDVYPS